MNNLICEYNHFERNEQYFLNPLGSIFPYNIHLKKLFTIFAIYFMVKSEIKSLFLSFIILFTLVYQSVHLWEHSVEQKEHCHNNDIENKSDCYICDFHFLSSDLDFHLDIIPERNTLFFIKEKIGANDLSFISKYTPYLFNLRAPPSEIKG